MDAAPAFAAAGDDATLSAWLYMGQAGKVSELQREHGPILKMSAPPPYRISARMNSIIAVTLAAVTCPLQR
jgi:hypothetical protein